MSGVEKWVCSCVRDQAVVVGLADYDALQERVAALEAIETAALKVCAATQRSQRHQDWFDSLSDLMRACNWDVASGTRLSEDTRATGGQTVEPTCGRCGCTVEPQSGACCCARS